MRKNRNKKGRSNQECLITFDATRVIVRDSNNFDVETGGVMVGISGDQMLIMNTGCSGKHSRHHATSFTSDSWADSQCLEKARMKYGNAVTVLGWWHKHPSGMEKPSMGDCRQVRLLLDEYNDGKPVLMGIVTKCFKKHRQRLSFRIFSLSPDDQLLEHPWKLVSQSSKEFQKVLQQTPSKPETLEVEFWKHRDFQFYLNPIGRDRIVREIRQLKQAGWQVTTGRRKSDHIMVLDLTKNGLELRFELPPEFPLNPPTVIRDGIPLRNLEILWEWNSLCCLTELAVKAECLWGSKNKVLETII